MIAKDRKVDFHECRIVIVSSRFTSYTWSHQWYAAKSGTVSNDCCAKYTDIDRIKKADLWTAA